MPEIRRATDKAVRQQKAREVLGVTTRRVRRLIQRVRAEGAGATVVWTALGGFWADAGDGETGRTARDLHPLHRWRLPGAG